jgi:hypothetical protein
MNRWAERIILAVMIGFVIFETTGGYIGSVTHTLVH